MYAERRVDIVPFGRRFDLEKYGVDRPDGARQLAGQHRRDVA